MTLKEALKIRGLSQMRAARLADIPACNFNQVVNGKQYCHPRWRRSISEVLGIPENELFPETALKKAKGGK